MVSFFRTDFARLPRRFLAVVLAFAWCAGLLLGAFTAGFADDSFFSTMRAALDCRVSISGLMAVTLLPLLFSAFAVFISCNWLLIPIAFLKAFSFSYMGAGLMAAFGDSGWLLMLLWMFSDCFVVPLLLWLWISACSATRETALRRTAALLPALIGIGYLDLQFVSPFLVNLLS